MWRPANPHDDPAIVQMCLSLNEEDPGPAPVPAENMRRTLLTLRERPQRGQALVLDVHGRPSGYALIIPFWSNELGGEVCEVDELYVTRDFRGRGHGAALFEAIERGDVWPAPVVAVALGITPGNTRARRLYERLGFATVGVAMVKKFRRLPP